MLSRSLSTTLILACATLAADRAQAQEGAARSLRASLPPVTGAPLVALPLDIDLDGDLDLLIGCDDAVRVWRNDGEAAFVDITASAWPNEQPGARELRAADIDSDSVAEVFAVSADGALLTWYDTAGDGRFVRVGQEPLGPVFDFAVGDLDGDTHVDLLIARGARRAPVLRLGDGRGGFSAANDKLPADLAGSVAVLLGSFTGGVDPELLAATPGGGLQLQRVVGLADAQRLRMTAEPAAQPQDLVPAGTGIAARGLVAVDLDGDGDQDLLIRDAAGRLHALRSTATADVWQDATAEWLPADLPPLAEVIAVTIAGDAGRGPRRELALLWADRRGACGLLRRGGQPPFVADVSLLPGGAGAKRGALRLFTAAFDDDHRADVLLVGPDHGVELWLAPPRTEAREAAFVEAARSGGR